LRVLTFATPPPEYTNRAHFLPSVGDGKSSIRRTAAKKAGADKVKCEDANVMGVRVRNRKTGKWYWIVILGHWSRPWLNGYRRVRMGNGEVRGFSRTMTYQQWINKNDGDVRCLKRLMRRNGDRVLTWDQAVAYASKMGVVLTPELKSRAFATIKDLAEHMVFVCKRHNYPLWSMALLKMRDAAGKCELMINAGGHFALIFGKFRSQARGTNKIAGWPVPPTVVWGPVSAKRWLNPRLGS
jgi:hypothetical protein